MRRFFVLCLAFALALFSCGQNRETPEPPRPTRQLIDFVAVLIERGYADAQLVGADPTFAATTILGCWVSLRQLDNGISFRIEGGINGPPHSQKVQEALDELGASPTKSELETTLKKLTKEGDLDPCR